MRALGLVLLAGMAGHASVLGVSTAAPSLTEARVRAELRAADQRPWLEYLLRSQRQMAADKAALAAERAGMTVLPAQAKEGVAFALLAWLTWHGLAGNVLAATGAARAVVLGKVSYG